MILPVWIQVGIALLAVFGVYSIVLTVGRFLFNRGVFSVAIRVKTRADIVSLESLLRDAEDAFFCGRGVPVVLIYRAALGDSAETKLDRGTEDLLRKYGAEYLIL